MNRITQLFAIVVIVFSVAWGQAFAGQSVTELLDAEAKTYVEALKSAQGETLLKLGIELQDSGVVDPRVFDAAETAALSAHDALNRDVNKKLNVRITGSLARFLASSPSVAHRDTLERFMLESKARRLRNLAKTLLTRSRWYADRNSIMNDFSGYNGDQSLKITRLLNLINAEDRAFGRYAAEAMKRQNITDAVLLDRMATILKDNYKNPGIGTNLDTLAWYARTLGFAGGKYKSLLEEINAYPELHKKMQKHVKKALRGK